MDKIRPIKMQNFTAPIHHIIILFPIFDAIIVPIGDALYRIYIAEQYGRYFIR